MVFIGDHRKFEDLVSFWNLRATCRQVCFVPISAVDSHLPLIERTLREGRYAINPHVENEADLQKGPSVAQGEFDEVVKAIAERTQIVAPARNWQPNYGDGDLGNIDVGSVDAVKGEEISFLDGEHLSPIKVIRPPYLDEIEDIEGLYSWSVELKFSEIWGRNELMLNAPRTPRIQHLVKYGGFAGARSVRVSRRGVVIHQDRARQTLHAAPLKTRQVFYALFEEAGLRANPSQPGRYVDQIIEKMGGSVGFDCRVFKIRGVRQLVNRLSVGDSLTRGNMRDEIMSVQDDRYGRNWRPDLYRGLRVRKGQQDELPDFSDIFRELLEHRVIRPGFSLPCSSCGTTEWYHVSQFSEEFTCRFCFEVQRVDFSSKKEWQFKADGPFQIRDSALGSLAVIVALWRFENQRTLEQGRYLTSTELRRGSDGKQFEVDYAYIHRRGFQDSRFDLVLGEAKGFEALESEQVRRMQDLADCFDAEPYLAFSTLKDKFSPAERGLLIKLVDDGYRVIALTREELDPYELGDRELFTLEDLKAFTIKRNLQAE